MMTDQIALDVDGIEFFFLARYFRTAARAKAVWEKIERETREGDVSVVRYQDSLDEHDNCVVLVSELKEGLGEAAHHLEGEGFAYEPDRRILRSLALRRAKRIVSGDSVLRHGSGVPMDRKGDLDYGPSRN